MKRTPPKICIPIKLPTTKEVVDFMEANRGFCDIFEIWLDQITDLDLNKIFAEKIKPILTVCKSEKEKGNFTGNEIDKIELLKDAITKGADFVDIDYQTENILIADLIKNKKQAKVILSYHNFEITPDLKSLVDVMQKMLKHKPDIVKIATMANSYKDAIIILNLAQSLSAAKIPFITIAIGTYGKMTRIITPLLGGEMMFAPVKIESSTANGQIEIKTLLALWNEFS